MRLTVPTVNPACREFQEAFRVTFFTADGSRHWHIFPVHLQLFWHTDRGSLGAGSPFPTVWLWCLYLVSEPKGEGFLWCCSRSDCKNHRKHSIFGWLRKLEIHISNTCQMLPNFLLHFCPLYSGRNHKDYSLLYERQFLVQETGSGKEHPQKPTFVTQRLQVSELRSCPMTSCVCVSWKLPVRVHKPLTFQVLQKDSSSVWIILRTLEICLCLTKYA